MSDPRPILVVGGTGMLGRPVVDALAARAIPVRVLSRDTHVPRPNIQFVRGAVEDASALAAAVEGCRAVHINLRATNAAELNTVEIGGTRAVVAASRAAGIERIGYVSGAGMEAADPKLPMAHAKQSAEAAVQGSGVEWMLFRATHFMESLDLFVRSGRIELMTPQPLAYHYLAARDYGRIVAQAYLEPSAANQAFTMLGPQPLTMRAALDIYVSRLHPGMKIRATPTAILRLVAALTGNRELKHASLLFSTFPKIPETGDRDITDTLLGRAETTLAQWCDTRAA